MSDGQRIGLGVEVDDLLYGETYRDVFDQMPALGELWTQSGLVATEYRIYPLPQTFLEWLLKSPPRWEVQVKFAPSEKTE